MVTRKARIVNPQPMAETNRLPSRSPRMPFNKKPASGSRIIRLSKWLTIYPFRSAYASTSSSFLRRTSRSTMGMAMAISAVATTKTRRTSTAPAAVAVCCANVTSARLTPLSMSSMHISMTSTLRRTMTPSSPSANSAAEVAMSICTLSTVLATHFEYGQRRHNRGDQQHRDEFELKPVRVQKLGREVLQAKQCAATRDGVRCGQGAPKTVREYREEQQRCGHAGYPKR